MSYYSVAEMETELKSNVEFQKYLYIRGFLFTDSGVNYNLDEYDNAGFNFEVTDEFIAEEDSNGE